MEDSYEIINNRFKIFKKWFIGSGGFSRVFMGYDTEQSKYVIIKVYNTQKTLKNEIEMLEYLQCTGIVPQIYANGKFNNTKNFVIMENLGISLHKIIQKNNKNEKLGLGPCLYFMYELIHCNKKIHNLGIIHRDVKPSNVVIHDKSIYLIDFGLAIRKEHAENVKTVGTNHYMSINSHNIEPKNYDEYDDIESCFYTLIYLLKGRLPWTNQKDKEIENSKKHLKTKMTKFSKLIQQIMQLCFNKNDKDIHTNIMKIIEDYLLNRNSSIQNEKEKFFLFVDAVNSY
uniref:non-specific serine/threonine protein kinase n=1 Tax=viral metagenome TaxID=1070528 RepID=A0A6C0J4Z8_9ZZZZ